MNGGYGTLSQKIKNHGGKKEKKQQTNKQTLIWASIWRLENILGYNTNKRSIDRRQKLYIEGFQDILLFEGFQNFFYY